MWATMPQVAVQPTCSDDDIAHHHELGFGPHERTHLLGLARTFAEKGAGLSSANIMSRVFRDERGQGCQHCGVVTAGRNYGEKVEFGFTGWRGPFCSASCYRAAYPAENKVPA